jgi:hypothetical protein
VVVLALVAPSAQPQPQPQRRLQWPHRLRLAEDRILLDDLPTVAVDSEQSGQRRLDRDISDNRKTFHALLELVRSVYPVVMVVQHPQHRERVHRPEVGNRIHHECDAQKVVPEFAMILD